jgi:hypothetical protein
MRAASPVFAISISGFGSTSTLLPDGRVLFATEPTAQVHDPVSAVFTYWRDVHYYAVCELQTGLHHGTLLGGVIEGANQLNVGSGLKCKSVLPIWANARSLRRRGASRPRVRNMVRWQGDPDDRGRDFHQRNHQEPAGNRRTASPVDAGAWHPVLSPKWSALTPALSSMLTSRFVIGVPDAQAT